MQVHEFYQAYANTPLGDRDRIISSYDKDVGGMTLNMMYAEVKAIEDKIRDDVIRRDKLVRAAGWYWGQQREKNNG